MSWQVGRNHRVVLCQRFDHRLPVLGAPGDPVNQQEHWSRASLDVAQRPAVERDCLRLVHEPIVALLGHRARRYEVRTRLQDGAGRSCHFCQTRTYWTRIEFALMSVAPGAPPSLRTMYIGEFVIPVLIEPTLVPS